MILVFLVVPARVHALLELFLLATESMRSQLIPASIAEHALVHVLPVLSARANNRILVKKETAVCSLFLCAGPLV